MGGVVESTLTIIDKNENEMATNTQQPMGEAEEEQQPNEDIDLDEGEDEKELDMQINCDLVLKDYDKISQQNDAEFTECKSQSHHYIHPYSLQSDFTFSSLYHLSDFTDCDLEKCKQAQTGSSNKSKKCMFKPDELCINRSD